MEDKIKARIKWHLNRLAESLANAQLHLEDDSPSGIVGALLDEDKRILETINLAKTLREFGGGQ